MCARALTLHAHPPPSCTSTSYSLARAQDIVKALFRDLKFKKSYSLGAVNSINFARIMFQITYYFYTYFKTFPNCDGEMSFSVPTGACASLPSSLPPSLSLRSAPSRSRSLDRARLLARPDESRKGQEKGLTNRLWRGAGNFGDILAGYYAKRMGLPVKHLIVATNSNDILARFFKDGNYDKHPVLQTFSPSMDIGISSNFERYLFYLFGEDSKELASKMSTFNETDRLSVDQDQLETAREDFLAASCTEQQTIDYISKFQKEYDYVLDPHTACGIAAVDACRSQLEPESAKHKIVVLGTAHPAKFSMAVAKAIGRPPELPKGLADLQGAEVRFQVQPAKTSTIKAIIEQTVPDTTGARNVYSAKHLAFVTMLCGAAFAIGVAVGKQ